MPLTTSCPLRARGLRGLSGLVLLWVLTGCAATPSLGQATWYGQRAGQQAVEVDFEAPPPQRAEQLRLRGVQLPQSAQGLADPRVHRDFIETRVTAVGFAVNAGGYLLSCEGLALPVLVPESHVDLGLTSAVPLNAAIYPDRDAALEGMAAGGSKATEARYAYYRGAGGALIVPTLFSPATTPRIARTMLEVRRDLSQTVQRDLKVLLLNLTGTRLLQGAFSRLVRVGSEPEYQPLHGAKPTRQESARVPRQPAPGSPTPTPAPAPASAQGSLAPSPGLVQALTGNNPTPRMAPGLRLPQDAAASPKAPGPLKTDRPIGPSPSQNAQLQADTQYLESMGATNIRVNQQQLLLDNRQRVGINRPDLQFDYKGRRYHVEYDAPTSGRGPAHQRRITSNDSNAETILLIVP